MEKSKGYIQADYYLRLNIKRNADQETIETAYARMALKHHPDVAGDSPEVQKRFAGINEAYSVLSKPHERQEYDEKLGSPEIDYQEEVISSDEGRDVTESVPARAPRKTGDSTRSVEGKSKPSAGLMSRKKLEKIKNESKKLITKGDFWKASSLMKKAVFAYPRDIELRKLLARAAAGRGRLREAVEELKTASDVEYFNPEIHYLMGKMYLQGEQIESATKSFRNALSWQEDYGPALRGLEKIRALKKKNLPWWKRLLRTGR
ncbi:MAG: DnaJ domain-containing protein [Candidatus Sabulitectum sp.]|nr:DnaJ domain-containing protein [Candidatus Sabulitectum sp.]